MQWSCVVLSLLVGLAAAEFRMDQIQGLAGSLGKLPGKFNFKSLLDKVKQEAVKIPSYETKIEPVIKDVVETSEGKKPSFCHGLDCPEFTVPQKFKDYELRDYSKTMWVTTQLSGIDYVKASKDMFDKLFAYIQGANEGGMKITMTSPVLIRIIPGQSQECESNFTMSFYLNDTLAKEGPPKPTDKTVYLNTMPDNMMVYVRSFSGYDMFSVKPWLKEAGNLAASIGDQKLYDTTHYFTAGYDSPFQIFNRHNEIWFLKK